VSFWNALQKSERWYYSKFEVHNLQLSRPIHSEGMKEAHAEQKFSDYALADAAKSAAATNGHQKRKLVLY